MLSPDQLRGQIDALMSAMAATTAFGKTVVAAWLIAQRGVAEALELGAAGSGAS